MSDVIAVLNAGSSSFKFSLFAVATDGLAVVARGQAEGLYTARSTIWSPSCADGSLSTGSSASVTVLSTAASSTRRRCASTQAS